MKRIFPLILTLLLPCVSPAQSPRMGVRGKDGSLKLLQLEQADVSVRFLDGVAETVLDLRFRNDGDRAVEGEFSLPLPAGATVSAYALEVNGALRDGVSVEKERARIAYETVKRRLIDPGIVEREAGNVYRTKVYPVPARGTKRLRISYNELLRSGAEGFSYVLPLDFPDPLVSFTCALSGAAADEIHIDKAAGLDFVDDGLGGFNVDQKNVKVAGVLKLQVKEPSGPRMLVESESGPVFFLSDRAPVIAPRLRPAPESVMLVWDASASGHARNHDKELALLDAWFSKLGDARVSLRLLRDQLEAAGEFEIRNGQWPKLKKALRKIDYDGGTDLSSIKVPAGQADVVLYVGDGGTTLGTEMPVASPFFYIHTGLAAPSRPLAKLACLNDGAMIAMSSDSDATALGKLTHQFLRLVSVEGDDVKDFLPDWDWDSSQPLRISGSLRESRSGKLEIRYGYGDDVVSSREVIYQPNGVSAGIVRRLHAQRVLAKLEEEPQADRDRIIAHCKRHGLVSDLTSLIVLERIEDYAEHEIAPPEPELQEQYRELVKTFKHRREAELGGLSHAWPRRLLWYDKHFPGYEAVILPRARQVGIWKKAVECQFEPGQLDAHAFATVAGWFDRASELIVGKTDLRSVGDYQKWREAIEALHAEGPKLAGTPLQAPPEGEVLAVSVRGLVVEPGVVVGKSGMTMRQAIKKAGGVHRLGGLDNVSLYRNAGKTVYNTLSEQFVDRPLFPGDMLVVGRLHPVNDWEVDPFSGPSTPSNPRNEAAVREQGDVWTSSGATGRDYSGAPFAAGGAVPVRATGIEGAEPDVRLLSAERVESEIPGWKEFVVALDGGGDPEAAYRLTKDGRIYQAGFYVEAARLLFSKQHTGLARRVLSNLVELRPDDESAARAYAFWLAEFGRTGEAGDVLSELCQARPRDGRLRLDLASIPAAAGSGKGSATDSLAPFFEGIESQQGGELSAIMLTEFNGLIPPGRGHPLARYDDTYRKNLAADIRIVVLSSVDDGGIRLEVREPGGLSHLGFGTPSAYGGRVFVTPGVGEYMIRHAVPGVYQISCASSRQATVRVVIHTDWGRPGHKSRVETLMLDGGMLRPVGKVEFGFHPPSP